MRHLVRLYPKGWRNRYGAELAALLQPRRATIGDAFDLVRGALDAHLHRSLATRLVFVPELGFRPGTTRVLQGHAEASVAGTSVTIVAVAAGPDQTDLLFEWEPPVVPEGPENWVVRIDRSGVHKRPPAELNATLVVDGGVHAPVRVEHRFRSATGYDLLEVTFPGVAAGARVAELRVTQGEQQWRVPFGLVRGDFVGTAALAETECEAITLRAKAVAWRKDQVVVALEAWTQQAGARVSQVGSGGPSGFPEKLKRTPQRTVADPLVLRDEQGRQSEEVRRLHHFSRTPDTDSPDPWPRRITSIFDWPYTDGMPVLTVPSMLIAEKTEPVVVDLRTLPTDIDLGAHRIRVLRAEDSPVNQGRRRIVFQFFEPAGPRHLLGPGSLQAHGMPADLSIRGEPDDEQCLWIDADILEVPIVTLMGAIVRVDGPWTLDLPLG